MRQLLTGLLAAAAIILCLSPAAAGADKKDIGTSRFEIEGRLDPAGFVHFKEIIRIERGRGTFPPLTRHLWIAPETFPLRQRVADVRVTDLIGKPLRFRTRRYGDFFNIDLLEVPKDMKTGVIIEYDLYRSVRIDGDRARLRWNLLGFFWRLPVTDMRVRLTLPEHPGKAGVHQTLEIDYAKLEPAKMPELRVVADTVEWRYAHTIEPDRAMVWRLDFPAKGLMPATARAYVEDLLRETGFVLLFLALVLGLVPVLLFAPAPIVIGIVRLWNAGAVAVAAYAIAKNSLYWIFEGTYRGAWGDVFATVAADMGLIGGLVAYAVVQERMLRRGARAAYFSQLALPVILAIPLPMYPTNAALLFLPLLGLPIATFWFRRAIALQFGAGTERIVEAVTTEGEIGMAELAERVGVGEAQLRRVLAELSALPVVCDFDAGRCYSPAVAAAQQDLLICAKCAGAVSTKGMELLACGYCGAEYAATRGDVEVTKPVPLLVESLARVVEVFGLAIVLWGITFALFGVISGVFDKAIGEALIVGGVVGGGACAIGAWFIGKADEFRRGERYGMLRLLTAVTAPLIVPAIAFAKLGGKRIRLHFGSYGIEQIVKALKKRGELSLTELAELLESTVEEAAEVARYLTANDILDAVYDRAGSRIVRRKLYREMAAEGACGNCGGIIGVIDGVLTCHYCGESKTT